MTEIIWEGTEDDLTAKIGDYVLKVFKNDTSSFYWIVLKKVNLKVIESGMAFYGLDIFAEREKIWRKQALGSAKAAVVKAYYNHINSK